MSADGLGRLEELLAGQDRLIISYSGGLDSSFLAKIAGDVLGDRLLCVILDSQLLPRTELARAERQAQEMGVAYRVIMVDPLGQPEFCANQRDRCYLCKRIMARALREVAANWGIECVADGLNLSDYSDYRPGIVASDQEGIWHPLVEAGMTKENIRCAARDIGLNFWDLPASACLASRIPYEEPITAERLARVEQSEEILQSMGLSGLRVRSHGDLARIEVPKEHMRQVLEHCGRVAEELKRAGFSYVTLDLEGYRTGSMNLISER